MSLSSQDDGWLNLSESVFFCFFNLGFKIRLWTGKPIRRIRLMNFKKCPLYLQHVLSEQVELPGNEGGL